MATLTIRNLDDATMERLRSRGGRHWSSLEEEVRAILKEVSQADLP